MTTYPYLEIRSAGGNLPLNAISETGVGWEAQAGITGLGLPPVDVQFDSGAGDGATYRGRRLLQRDLDVPLKALAPNRATLKAQTATLGTVLASPLTLHWWESASESWVTKAHYISGGDYTYGNDTDGNTFCFTTITVKTENAYWESGQAAVSYTSALNPANPLTVAVTNAGTLGTPPSWSVTGPTLGFEATNAAGATLSYLGFIDVGTTVTVDHATGTVYDNNGFNRYNDLDAAPNFWNLPAGNSNITVRCDRTSSAYTTVRGGARRNHVTNPALTLNATGWTLNGFAYNAGSARLSEDTNQALTSAPLVSTTITGLTVGTNYVARMVVNNPARAAFPTKTKPFEAVAWVMDGGVRKAKDVKVSATAQNISIEFTAESTSVTLNYQPRYGKKKAVYHRGTGNVDSAYVGIPGSYFDGTFASTGTLTIAWAGTAHASQSTATPVAPNASTSQVAMTYKPRKLLMI